MVFRHFSKQPIFHMSFTELRKKIFNGKNPKFVYYAEAYAKLHLPRFVLRPLSFLGTISLELYLIHIEYVLRPVARHHLGYGMTLFWTLLIAIPAAYLLHWAVDRVVRLFRPRR